MGLLGSALVVYLLQNRGDTYRALRPRRGYRMWSSLCSIPIPFLGLNYPQGALPLPRYTSLPFLPSFPPSFHIYHSFPTTKRFTYHGRCLLAQAPMATWPQCALYTLLDPMALDGRTGLSNQTIFYCFSSASSSCFG